MRAAENTQDATSILIKLRQIYIFALGSYLRWFLDLILIHPHPLDTYMR